MKKIINLLLLLTVFSMVFAGCGKKASGLFDDMEWGTSYEDAKQILSEKEGVEVSENADGSKLMLEVEKYRGVEGVTARIECSFEDALMDEVFVYLEFDETLYSNEEVMSQYTEIFSKEYGKCSKDTSETKSWKLGKSEVELANFSYGVLVMDYKPL